MQNEYGKKTYSRLLILFVILAIVLGYLMLSATGAGSKETPKEKVLTLTVVPAAPENVAVSSSYIGYVTPINSVSIVPYITGFLDKINVKGGQEVKAGDTLVIIRQDEYKARLDAAQASVLKAQSAYGNAKTYFERVKKAGGRAVSKAEFDNAKNAYFSAQADLAQAKADRALAQVNYDYTVIKAPIDGIVGNIDLTPGGYVSPSSAPLLKVIQYNPTRVVFSIADKDYLREKDKTDLFSDEKIKLRLADGKIFEPQGTFRFTSNELDKSTNALAVYADFDNPDRTLVANAYVDVIVEKDYQNGILINQNAVSMEADGNYVYTVKNGMLSKTKVEVVSTVGNNYLLRNTFSPEEYIVTQKITGMTPGRKVNIRVAAKAEETK